ncbi:MAG: ATPase, T2SS/T4P/T4SS family [Candidatus Komeilibacteria bacterium]
MAMHISNQHDNDSYIINLVAQIINKAVDNNASDIHFEPYDNIFRVRVRIDGILSEAEKLALNLAERITARLKIIANLDITEKRLPQDGRFSIKLKNNTQGDFRINSCPTLFGEKIAIRVLNNSAKFSLAIDKLGMEKKQQADLLLAIKRSQGLILVTGPTGSGKTSTLYSILQLLDSEQKNISTVEDPIEIRVQGINQVNINPKIGLNFTTVLKAFLRQDPDIIMVGEIRDPETAQIAIKAAQTGHLVLSTLHHRSSRFLTHPNFMSSLRPQF